MNFPALQGGNQRFFIDHWPTPGVNENGGGLHFGKLFGAEQMMRFVG